MPSKEKKLSIIAVSGSIRPNNYTSKALALVLDELKKHPEVDVKLIDPREMTSVLSAGNIQASAKKLQSLVAKATGVILSTPEYHGSYSSVIKLIIDNLGYPSALSGKPVALLGVASGQIGAIKALEHLRSVCSHVGAIVLPQVVSVAFVDKIFDEKGHCSDKKVEKRIRSAAAALIEYIERHICPIPRFKKSAT